MSRDDAINIMKKSEWNEKNLILINKRKISTYYQINREKLLDWAKQYYEKKQRDTARKNDEILREKSKNKYK